MLFLEHLIGTNEGTNNLVILHIVKFSETTTFGFLCCHQTPFNFIVTATAQRNSLLTIGVPSFWEDVMLRDVMCRQAFNATPDSTVGLLFSPSPPLATHLAPPN
jgi:hypothetical protein